MADPVKEFADVDQQTVDQIVQKMRKQDISGTQLEKEENQELRGELLGKTESAHVQLQNVEDLAGFNNPLIRKLIEIYLKLQDPLKPLSKLISQLSASQTLNYYLYSANMKYSLDQYLALTTTVTFLAALVGAIFGIVISFILGVPILYYPLLLIMCAGFFGVLGLFVTLMYPKTVADKRGQDISVEMPFALRHMATELKSGAGLYRTIQMVAIADYGILSEEFARTVNEIEEGTDAKDALKNMALRVQSVSMRNALNHIVRAMKTGGNLSDVMNDIADDVSVEIQTRIMEFSEKMNFFGVIFIFIGIILPVMVAILGGIANAPLPLAFPIPLTVPVLILFYIVAMPLILSILVIYLKAIQPKV